MRYDMWYAIEHLFVSTNNSAVSMITINNIYIYALCNDDVIWIFLEYKRSFLFWIDNNPDRSLKMCLDKHC